MVAGVAEVAAAVAGSTLAGMVAGVAEVAAAVAGSVATLSKDLL